MFSLRYEFFFLSASGRVALCVACTSGSSLKPIHLIIWIALSSSIYFFRRFFAGGTGQLFFLFWLLLAFICDKIECGRNDGYEYECTNVWHRDVVSITTSSKINCECFSFTFGWNSFTYSCPFFRLILRISRFNSSSFHSMRMVHTDIIRQMHKCDQQQHHRFYEAGGCVWVYLCDEILRFAQTYLIDTNNIYKYGFYELQMLLLYAEAFFVWWMF